MDEARNQLKNAQGVVLSLPKKQEIMVYLKKVMQEGRLRIPFDRALMNEMNSERQELTKTGQVQFHTRPGPTMSGSGHLHLRCMLRGQRFQNTLEWF